MAEADGDGSVKRGAPPGAATPATLYAAAFAAYRRGDALQALAILQHLLRQAPGHADAWNLAGVIHGSRQELPQAIACYRRALAAGAPPGTWVNLGLAEQRRGAPAEAEAAYREALRRDDRLALAWQKLAQLQEETGRPEEALASHRCVLQLDPGNLRSLGEALTLRRYLADWDPALGPSPEALLAAWRQAPASDLSPLQLLALPEADAPLQKMAAAKFAATQWGAQLAQPPLSAPPTPLEGRRLRVGYTSSDLRRHAVSYLLLEAIEARDHASCEVFLYAQGPAPPGDVWRARARAAADRFVELPGDDLAAARLIADDRLDVLVDLNGYTGNARIGVLALRPAPTSATWLGYIGTLGDGRLVDYVIGDAVATPLARAGDFAEHLALLPHCYQPNPSLQPIQAPTRAEAGLPEEAVVFCSFNQAYKLHPALWDDWCAILAAVPGSLLWLAPPRAEVARANLRREAEARGVDGARIVFGPQLPLEEHLSRLALADLALDTWPYNSGTTAADALRAGVPLLTFTGDTFAGRMATSLLRSLGLHECIRADRAAVVAEAVRLGNDAAARAALRSRLAALLPTARLFDPKAMAADLERLYRAMHANALAGRHVPIALDP
ncbi:glycosyltransferase family 41 protein [Pseudoxanthomonas sp. J35]|uniref:O-linked N-acetylglucosamine transferase, SPINDLY family protein n=1 Tax=Pseudoxanthomonas sp. J35 TaxID=935852 RepID=UPI0004BC582C|nr:glycosyltransferase family 41 protein [Pseudoxanthomonas sp. J35]